VKKILVFFVILVFCGQAFSAPAFGLRGGLNVANATHGPDHDYQSDSRNGLILGGGIEFSISESNRRTLRVEFAYVEKGWRQGGDFLGIAYNGDAEINEFVLTPAVLFRFPSDQISPFIAVGADVGINLKAKGTVNFGDEEISGDIEDWSDINAGVDLGGGLIFPTGKGEIETELRFNIGLMNMYTGDADYSVNTNGIQFIFGYNFTKPEK
jgi:hypothetical protein